MTVVLRTVLDPTTQNVDLHRGERFAGRRHRIVGVGDSFDQQAAVCIVGNHDRSSSRACGFDRAFTDIQPKAAFAGR